jgi:hypothetical protein
MRLVTSHKDFYSIRGFSSDRSTLLALSEIEPPADQLPQEEGLAWQSRFHLARIAPQQHWQARWRRIHSDQFRGLSLSNGARTKQREDICIHAPPRRVYVPRTLLSPPMVKPESRDRSKGILGCGLFCGLCGFPLCHWIKANSEQFARLGVAFSGQCEGHFRVLAKGHEFSFPSCLCAHRHSFPPAGVTQRKKAPAVADAIRFLLCLGLSNLYVRQWHFHLLKTRC